MFATISLLHIFYFASTADWYVSYYDAITSQVQVSIIGYTSSLKQEFYFITKESEFSQSSLTLPITIRGVQHRDRIVEPLCPIYGFYVFNTVASFDFASEFIKDFGKWENRANIRMSFGGWTCYTQSNAEYCIDTYIEFPSKQWDVKINEMRFSLIKTNGEWKIKKFGRSKK